MIEGRLTISEVPGYIEETQGVRRGRSTVYSWINKGVIVTGQRFRLRTEVVAGQLYTRKEWVDAFLGRIS